MNKVAARASANGRSPFCTILLTRVSSPIPASAIVSKNDVQVMSTALVAGGTSNMLLSPMTEINPNTNHGIGGLAEGVAEPPT